MARRHKRSKEYGYEVETQFLKSLRTVFPNLERVGSMGYSKAHADLVQKGQENDVPIRIVATRDKRRTPLVTMSLDDLLSMLAHAAWAMEAQDGYQGVVVQCKGRARSALGTLYQELKEATK